VVLIGSGFVRSEVGKCLFSKIAGETIIDVYVYADDIVMVGSEQAQIGSLTERIRGRFKEITEQEGKQVES
jgi:hypothetical protein